MAVKLDEQTHAGPRPVLDYEVPQRRDPLRWLTAPLTLERAVIIWALWSGAMYLLEPEWGAPHLLVGLAAYAVAAVVQWRAHWMWRASTLLALMMLAVGTEMFISPWREECFRMEYWTVYNQTYRWNRDASLRVAWVPAVGAVGLVLSLVGARVHRRIGRSARDPRTIA